MKLVNENWLDCNETVKLDCSMMILYTKLEPLVYRINKLECRHIIVCNNVDFGFTGVLFTEYIIYSHILYGIVFWKNCD